MNKCEAYKCTRIAKAEMMCIGPYRHCPNKKYCWYHFSRKFRGHVLHPFGCSPIIKNISNQDRLKEIIGAATFEQHAILAEAHKISNKQFKFFRW